MRSVVASFFVRKLRHHTWPESGLAEADYRSAASAALQQGVKREENGRHRHASRVVTGEEEIK